MHSCHVTCDWDGCMGCVYDKNPTVTLPSGGEPSPCATPKPSSRQPISLDISLADKSDEDEVIALAISQNYLVPGYWSWMRPLGLWEAGPHKFRQCNPRGRIVEGELTTKVFKISDKGRIIGFIAISEPSKTFAETQQDTSWTYYYIHQLLIHNDYRRMGIATRLLEHAFAQYDKSSVWLLDVQHEAVGAQKLYKRHGFEICDDMHGIKLERKSHKMMRDPNPRKESTFQGQTEMWFQRTYRKNNIMTPVK